MKTVVTPADFRRSEPSTAITSSSKFVMSFKAGEIIFVFFFQVFIVLVNIYLIQASITSKFRTASMTWTSKPTWFFKCHSKQLACVPINPDTRWRFTLLRHSRRVVLTWKGQTTIMAMLMDHPKPNHEMSFPLERSLTVFTGFQSLSMSTEEVRSSNILYLAIFIPWINVIGS